MSLTVTYSEIERSVARRLGYPLASANRSTDEQDSINDAIRTGLRWFYFPTGEMTHEWSFLVKLYEETLVSGQNWYLLPDDFERVASSVDSSLTDHPLTATTEDSIRLRIANEGLSGGPEYCAVRNRQIEGDTRYEFGVYPTPDAVGTLSFWYLFSPSIISESNPEPLGGAVHADTIMLACLAAAEAQMNPEMLAGEGGVHYQLFNEKLAAAVMSDRIQRGVQ